MNATRAKSAAETSTVVKAIQNAATAAAETSTTEPDSTFTALWRRLGPDDRKLLRKVDDERGKAIVAEQEKVLQIVGHACQQFGHPEIFELIYLTVYEELDLQVGTGQRWLAERASKPLHN